MEIVHLKERNITLDYFRLVLSFLVILIHMQPLFQWDQRTFIVGWFLSNGISRIAVPCFFILNGYFLCGIETNSKKIFKQVKHLLLIYFVWVFIYLYNVPSVYYFIDVTSKEILYKGFGHLWYISTLLEAIILFYFIKKLKISDISLLILALVFFSIGCFIQIHYCAPHIDNLYYSRNFLFFAFPFISLGYLTKKYFFVINKTKTIYLSIIFFISLITLLYESYCIMIHEGVADMMWSLFIICPVLIFLILKKSKYAKTDDLINKLSGGVYFIHPLVITLFCTYLVTLDLIFKSFLVFFISILLSYSIIQVNTKKRFFL